MQRKNSCHLPVANDDISRLIVEVKSVHQVFFGFCGQRGRSIEFAVLQKNRQPMQHRVTGSVQIQNGQTVAFDFIPVSVAIVVDANAPLFTLKALLLCAVPSFSIIFKRIGGRL